MPRRRTAVVLGLAAALLGTVLLAGCSGDAPAAAPGATTTPAPTPTAVGDRPRVEVLDPGTGERRVLGFALVADASTRATLDISQQTTRDQGALESLPVSVPFTSVVAATDGDGDQAQVTTTQTYGEPTVDATGLGDADVAALTKALSGLAGTSSTLVVRPDGTAAAPVGGDAAAGVVGGQVRDLVAVFPLDAVGVGARWTATSVEEVDGVVVDQVSTYTLTALEGDTYDLDVTLDRVYRPGGYDAAVVRSGRSTVTASLSGSLGQLLPDRASGNLAAQVTYAVDGQATVVRTTAAVTLTAG